MKFIDPILLKICLIASFPPPHCEMTSAEAHDFIIKIINEQPVFDTDTFIDEIKVNSDNGLIHVSRVMEILKSQTEIED